MDNFLKIVDKYYLVFSIVSILLVLALIGYFVEKNTSKDIKVSKKSTEKATNVNNEESTEKMDTL